MGLGQWLICILLLHFFLSFFTLYLIIPRYVMKLRLKECAVCNEELDGNYMFQDYDDRKSLHVPSGE
jgi:hypothetical protein